MIAAHLDLRGQASLDARNSLFECAAADSSSDERQRMVFTMATSRARCPTTAP